jgi:hypothetical protein
LEGRVFRSLTFGKPFVVSCSAYTAKVMVAAAPCTAGSSSSPACHFDAQLAQTCRAWAAIG